MTAAIEAVESGRAEVIVVAYFDRLFRSLEVQAQVLDRVEQAGGRVLAAEPARAVRNCCLGSRFMHRHHLTPDEWDGMTMGEHVLATAARDEALDDARDADG